MKNDASVVKKGGKTDKEKSGKTAWRCENCGKVHYSDEPSDECPYCLFPYKPFKQVGSEE